jgi:8-oxo-dGTP diphosphatase
MDGYYSLPAGHLDGGESLVEGMIREAKEEINITIEPKDLKLVHVSNNLVSDPERIDFFFLCTSWTGDLKINEPDKCDDIKWVSIDNIPENTTKTVKTALIGAENNTNYSEYRGE